MKKNLSDYKKNFKEIEDFLENFFNLVNNSKRITDFELKNFKFNDKILEKIKFFISIFNENQSTIEILENNLRISVKFKFTEFIFNKIK